MSIRPSKNFNDELSRAAQEILDEGVNEKVVKIPGTKIKITLALENKAMVKKYREEVLSTHEYHGKRFLYVR